MILGVDVSNVGQGRVDWGRAGAAVGFGLCKASEGSSFSDPSLRVNLAGLKAAGKPRGAYHFLRGGTDGGLQCRHFLAAVGDPTGVILALDVEVGGAGSQVVSFLSEFTRRLPGRRILVYSNRGLWAASGGPADITRFAVVGWHAGYLDGRYIPSHGSLAAQWADAAPKTRPSRFGGISRYPMVQFTDHATVPGITGGCDGNIWLDTASGLAELTGADPAPALQAQPALMEDMMRIVRHVGDNKVFCVVPGHSVTPVTDPATVEGLCAVTGQDPAKLPVVSAATLAAVPVTKP